MKLTLAFLIASATALTAAPFANLGFDAADTTHVILDPGPRPQGLGPATELLPSWQLAKGTQPQSTLGLNLDLLQFGTATLISADQSDYFHFPVEGGYALFLRGSPGNADPFALTQRGEIPAGSQLLSYRYGGEPFLVSVNGSPLTPSNQSGTVQAFDISEFAGQTVDLSFTMTGSLMPTEASFAFLDSIMITVPEPATLGMLGLGLSLAFVFGKHRRGTQPA